MSTAGAVVNAPFEMDSLPEGWFTLEQAVALHRYALETMGPILEVGPWVGRSTAVICHALSMRPDAIAFHTVDYGIESEEEWQQRFGSSVRSKAKPDLYLRHIDQPGGTLTSLRRNLAERGLLSYVTIHRGDFHDVAPPGPYGLIFCDATHNRQEIDSNVGALIEKLGHHGVLCCDDINDDLAAYLLTKFPFKWHQRNALLFSGGLSPLG